MLRNLMESIASRIASILEPISRLIGDALRPLVERAAAAIEPIVSQLRNRYERFEPREKMLVQIAAMMLGVLVAYNFIYQPIVGLDATMQAAVAARERDLREIRRLAALYSQSKANLAEAEHRTVPSGKDFSLFSVVEGSLSKTIGHDKIASIAPGSDRKLPEGFTEHTVNLKLSNVNLAQVVDALYAINSIATPVSVENLRIQRRMPDTRSYDLDLTCIALARDA
jgi:type II secretory pathway component PulM